MQPTININLKDPTQKGDRIFINQYCSYTNNDIIVAKVDWHSDHIIKRLIGIPGDKIEIKDLSTEYGVYVNDSLLYTKEKYGSATFPASGSIGYYQLYLDLLKNPDYSNIVYKNNISTYIVLGDNQYFVMGDNWGHTTDSITQGPITKEDILGKVDFIIDVNNDKPLLGVWLFMKKIFSFKN